MTKYLLTRIEALQEELGQLRKALTSEGAGRKQRTRLGGLWKGVEVTEQDFREAKQAVFRDAYRS